MFSTIVDHWQDVIRFLDNNMSTNIRKFDSQFFLELPILFIFFSTGSSLSNIHVYIGFETSTNSEVTSRFSFIHFAKAIGPSRSVA